MNKKIIASIFFASSLLLSYNFTIADRTFYGFEQELNKLISRFLEGVSNDEAFESLVIEFSRLKADINEFNEKSNTSESNELFEKAEALASLVGALSPDGRNFDLTINKYNLAAPILKLNGYNHPHYSDGTYCLPIVHFFLWNNQYQAILLVNSSQKLIRYEAKTVETKDVASERVTETSITGGVDCYSLRGIGGYFTTKEGVLQCVKLECETRPYCTTEY